MIQSHPKGIVSLTNGFELRNLNNVEQKLIQTITKQSPARAPSYHDDIIARQTSKDSLVDQTFLPQ
jgi:hypothetical protein